MTDMHKVNSFRNIFSTGNFVNTVSYTISTLYLFGLL